MYLVIFFHRVQVLVDHLTKTPEVLCDRFARGGGAIGALDVIRFQWAQNVPISRAAFAPDKRLLFVRNFWRAYVFAKRDLTQASPDN